MDTDLATARTVDGWISTSRGTDGIDYQRSAQITWWSILQGISVGTLVTKIPDVFNQVFHEGHWYLLLYIATSFLIITNVWVQMAWVILIARWRLTLIHTMLILLLGTTLSVACLQVDAPWYWYPAITVFVLSGITVYTYNLKYRTMDDLIKAEISVQEVITIYIGFLAFCSTASYLVYFYRSAMMQTLWGIVVFLLACFALWVQHIRMKAERILRDIP